MPGADHKELLGGEFLVKWRTKETAKVMHETLDSLGVASITGEMRGWGRLTIMTPQSSMSKESHIDGRSRFRNTFEGTCSSKSFRDEQNGNQIGAHLKDRVRKEENSQGNIVLIVVDM